MVKYSELGLSGVSLDELIVEAIFIIRDIVNAESETNMSTVTKSASFFEKTQLVIKSLAERYIVRWEKQEA